MLAWKANYGYLTTGYSGASLLTINLNDIVFTDNSFVALLDGITSLPHTSLKQPTPSTAYNFIKSHFPFADSFYAKFTSTAYYSTKQDYANKAGLNIISTLPSIRDIAPNLYSYLSTTTIKYVLPVVLVPALKLLFSNKGTYEVADGIATRKYTGNGIFGSYSPLSDSNLGAMAFVTTYSGNASTESLSDYTKYKNAVVDWSTYHNELTIWTDDFTSGWSSYFNFVFGTHYAPPDAGIPDNPYDPLDPSGEGGGGGTFDDSSDPIIDSSIPTLSMADTGFTRIYNPTLSQVNQLAEYMWKTDNIFETLWNKLKQVFENPMDVMIAFNIVPVPVPDGGTKDFTIMYIPTGIPLTAAASQFVDVDCGTVDLTGFYGSALDYSPYTKVHCYLPYIGTVSLDTDEVMNNTLQVKYRVDIVSGGCVAKILVSGNVLYQYSGHCSISVPFTASDFSQYVNAMLKVASVATGFITGGAAGGALSMGASQSQVDKAEEGQISYGALIAQNVTNTVQSVTGSKPIAQHAGTFNGNTGYLGVRYPYLIIEVPRQCLPSTYQSMNGYPSMISLPLGDCSGYTVVQQVQLTGVPATEQEHEEILKLLKGGVIF